MRHLKKTVLLILAAILCLQAPLSVQAWSGTLTCTVLGDSIAKGYSSDKANEIKPYGQLVTEQLALEGDLEYVYQNFAKSGLDTTGLNENYLVRQEVLDSIEASDVILMTMGSNDLLNEFKRAVQEILKSDTKYRSANQALGELKDSVKQNPLIVLKIIDMLSKWDYSSFEAQWVTAMDTIALHKKEDAQMLVTNIYNPVYNLKLPGTMNKVVEDIIGNMNGIIEDHAEQYGYQVVDLFDSNIVAFVQGDGLHPTQDGQQMIADAVYQEIGNPDDMAQIVDGQAVKGEEKTTPQSDPKQTTEQDTKNEDKATTKKSKPDNSTQTAIIIGAGVFAVCLILLIVVLRNRPRKKE